MAQALKFGKGVWATKTGSSMAYSDTNDRYKPLPFNVERDSIATRVNKEGLIEVVGHDKLRIDYTDTDKGVALLEPQRTNLVTNSNVFANWTKQGNITVTDNQVISPDGLQNASIIDFSNATSADNGIYRFAGTPSASVSRTIYLKGANGGETLLISDPNQGGGLTVTLSTEWQRFDYTGGSVSLCGIWLKNSVGNVIHAYGTQIEVGSFPTSYIPTSGSTVTRAADLANNAGNSEVFNDSEGVLFADVSALANDASVRHISLSDGSTSNRIIMALDSNNQIRFYFQGTGGNILRQFTVASILLPTKILIKYKSNDFAFWVNGFEVETNTSAITFSGLNNISFNNPYQGGTSPLYGKTKEIGYYDEILTDSELEYLTSYRSLSELVKELNLNIL